MSTWLMHTKMQVAGKEAKMVLNGSLMHPLLFEREAEVLWIIIKNVIDDTGEDVSGIMGAPCEAAEIELAVK